MKISVTKAEGNLSAVLGYCAKGPVQITSSADVVGFLLSPDIYRDVRVETAMALVTGKLRDRDPDAWKILHRASKGDLSGREAFEQLGLTGYGQLLDLLGLADLPLPMLPSEQIDEMAATMLLLLNDIPSTLQLVGHP